MKTAVATFMAQYIYGLTKGKKYTLTPSVRGMWQVWDNGKLVAFAKEDSFEDFRDCVEED